MNIAGSTASPRPQRFPGILPAPRPQIPYDLLGCLQEPLSLLLWHALRNVSTWAEDVPSSGLFPPLRPVDRELFSAGERQAPSLSAPLAIFSRLRETPEQVTGEELATACSTVAEWAMERGLALTAAQFIEAAAYSCPTEARWANRAGRVCRRAGEHSRSAVWYERGFHLAVRSQNREEAIRALLGYGGLLYAIGAYEQARPMFARAVRRAARTGRSKQAAEAEHDLMTIASEIGTYRQGASHLRRALRHYPVHHWRIPYLVHDFAYLLIQSRFYTPALPLLNHAAVFITAPPEQALVMSAISRAAAGAGRYAEYCGFRERCLGLLALYDEHAPAAFRNLVLAAHLANDVDEAARLAAETVVLARERREHDIAESCERLLAQLATGALAPRETAPSEDDHVAELSHRLLSRLRRWQKRGRGRPVSRFER
jgi:tetratricopeptide (TPR) repeat protein